MQSSTDAFMFLVVFMAITGMLLIFTVTLFGGGTDDDEGFITAMVEDIVETAEETTNSEEVVKEEDEIEEEEPTTLAGLATVSDTDSKSAQLLAEDKIYEQLDEMYLEDVEVIMDELVAIKEPTFSDERTLYLATKVFYEFENTISALLYGGKYSSTGKDAYKDVLISSTYSDSIKKTIVDESFDGEMPLTKAEKEAIALQEKKELELEAIEVAKSKENMLQVLILMGAITPSILFVTILKVIPKNKNKEMHTSLKHSM